MYANSYANNTATDQYVEPQFVELQYVEPDINQLWAEKIQKLSRRVWAIANGDDDFYQEGILGIRIGLTRNPYATDAFLLSAAKWAMLHYRDKGVSVDNGIKWTYTKRLADGTARTYQKNMAPVYIDGLVSNFRTEYPDSSYSPDVLALDRVCAEKFYRSLDKEEAEFAEVCIQTLNGHFYNAEAMRELGIGHVRYKRIRRSAYRKFIRAFGTDEEVAALYQ